ncbi:MAG: phosphate regulon transcriptional regulator PhoB [Coxiellaceae bacterium]|nr:phosphate regulon transcriptional regulator PhoB [Coxiellaceae bacterium]
MPKQHKKTVLIVDDEQSIRNMLRYALQIAGFDVVEAEEASDAKKQIQVATPNIILLDWMLPGTSGIEFAKQLKASKNTSDIPIILLTAKAEEDSKVEGLNTGADDYVIKPFSPRELIARIHAVLRRGPLEHPDGTVRIRDLTIHMDQHKVEYRGETMKFGPLEYRLLCFFITHQDRVYSRDQLLSHVWGNDAYLDERTVDVHIRRLRKRLSTCGYDDLIETVHGIGYRFSDKKKAHD